MSLLDKILNKNKVKYDETKGEIYGEILLVNPYIDIISNACAECYKTDNKSKDYNARAEYISRRIATGHESILEHSNIVMIISMTTKAYPDLVEFQSLCKFLNTKIKIDNDNVYLLIGGSLRGYKYIVRTIQNSNNVVYKVMLNQLYHLNSNIFKDFIDDGIMVKEYFKDDIKIESRESRKKNNICIENIDNIGSLEMKVKKYGFKKEDLLHMCTVTVYFARLPRVISQQLTRHRNAITQASQRYINYSEACFISPAECKPDRYNKDKLYKIKALDTDDIFTLDQLGKEIISIYPQLLDQGLLKEDARAYLPNNVETSLFVTFTFWNLYHFLVLRMDKSAQADIRQAANDIYYIINNVLDISLDQMQYELEPVYKKMQDNEDAYDNIDEIIE